MLVSAQHNPWPNVQGQAPYQVPRRHVEGEGLQKLEIVCGVTPLVEVAGALTTNRLAVYEVVV